MTTQTTQPNKTAVWIQAMRPRTLPLALAAIIMGAFLAAADGVFNGWVAGLAGLTAVFLQILSNLANDYGDSVHGADHVQRQGPQRAVQSGAIPAATMRRAMALFVLLAVASGVALLWLAFGVDRLPYVLLFMLLGAGAIGAAIAYTNGKRPYGYAGLGDLFVLIFFGWVGVLGTYFLQALAFRWLLLLPATSCGLLAVGVLNVNNIRDIESDRQAGKRSIPVRVGPQKARLYHWLLLAGAVGTAVLYVLFDYRSLWQFLFVLALPLLARHGTAVAHTHSPLKLNPLLKQLSLITLFFIITFGIGQIIG
ncbi:MAG: 1,4-dihydroxy-2-naphthoate polyprenyltransferase [Chloroflexota bacterium]